MLPGRVGGVDGAAAVVDGTDRRATGGEGGRSMSWYGLDHLMSWIMGLSFSVNASGQSHSITFLFLFQCVNNKKTREVEGSLGRKELPDICFKSWRDDWLIE